MVPITLECNFSVGKFFLQHSDYQLDYHNNLFPKLLSIYHVVHYTELCESIECLLFADHIYYLLCDA